MVETASAYLTMLSVATTRFFDKCTPRRYQASESNFKCRKRKRFLTIDRRFDEKSPAKVRGMGGVPLNSEGSRTQPRKTPAVPTNTHRPTRSPEDCFSGRDFMARR
jgi:hypothetical protein